MSLFLWTNAEAQTNSKVNAFFKEYFKRYQLRDFDWIMNHYASYSASQKDFQEKYGRMVRNEIRTKEDYNRARKSYRKSLIDEYGIQGIVPRSKFVKIVLENTRPIAFSVIKIIFQDVNGQQYYIDPGFCLENGKDSYAYYGRKISGYYYGKIVKDKQKRRISTVSMHGDTSADLSAPVFEPVRKAYVEAPRQSDDNKIFISTQQSPGFPGGEDKLYEWVRAHLKYPKIAKDAGISGDVYITFVVNKDGSLEQFKMDRNIGGGCGKEALRLVKAMPKWHAAMNNGHKVRCMFTLPVRFELPKK